MSAVAGKEGPAIPRQFTFGKGQKGAALSVGCGVESLVERDCKLPVVLLQQAWNPLALA
ncbi:hypothetical protein [Aminobacter aminovorans]|uniref:hypothetical protein n=1 Tax=Aminobacter aminovorans TaxID=83263 RepID=UPI001FDF6890|nr:hypothetical protein [Aminobacter aminovorans]